MEAGGADGAVEAQRTGSEDAGAGVAAVGSVLVVAWGTEEAGFVVYVDVGLTGGHFGSSGQVVAIGAEHAVDELVGTVLGDVGLNAGGLVEDPDFELIPCHGVDGGVRGITDSPDIICGTNIEAQVNVVDVGVAGA